MTWDGNKRKVERIFVKSMEVGKCVGVELRCRSMRDAIFTIVQRWWWWWFVKKREKSVRAPFFIHREEKLAYYNPPLLINLPLKQNAYRKLKRGEFCSRGCRLVNPPRYPARCPVIIILTSLNFNVQERLHFHLTISHSYIILTPTSAKIVKPFIRLFIPVLFSNRNERES